MSGFFSSLWRITSYRGLLFAFFGAALTLPLSPFAFAAAVSMDVQPATRAFLALVTLAVLLGLAGLTGTARRLGVWLANALLGTDIPAPGRTRPAFPARLRSAAWLVLSTGLSGTLLTALFFLLLGLLAPVLWLEGGTDRVAFVWDTVPLGAWTVPFGLLMLLAAALLIAAATRGLRAAATALLGPSATERAELAERRAAVLAQRNRLARELHDSIGHTLTTSTIQAAAAAELVDADPAQVRRALGTIEESSRTALEDLDHVLGLLREEPSAKAPSRTLTEMDILVERAREAGLDVKATVSGSLGALPATVSREGYRIVQEGITNALRHAGTGTVEIRIGAGPERLGIEIVNPLPGDDPRTGRRGLTGLAERVEALRGELTAGPEDGRWRLAATIPLRTSA